MSDDAVSMAIRRWNRILIMAMCVFIVVSYSGHKVFNAFFDSAADLPQHARYILHKALPDPIGGGFESSTDEESMADSDDEGDGDSVVPFGKEVFVNCRNICNGNSSNSSEQCMDLENAVLTYKQDVISKKMHFRQWFHPKIFIDVEEKPKDYLFVNNCPIDKYFKQFSAFFQQESCAIVGNSGVLLNSNCGRDIDAHAFVLRANLKPIQNYNHDVGKKCNLTAFNYETMKDLYKYVVLAGPGDKDHQKFVQRLKYLNDSVLWFPKSTKKKYVREEMKKIAYAIREKNKLRVRMAYSYKPVSVERDFRLDGYATNGFNMFAIARSFCKRITLYGFYPYQSMHGKHIPHHYFAEDKEFQYRTAEHDFINEFNILNDLHEKGEITLVTGRCRQR